MSIDGYKKPFPFLRKGDGLSRYSSIKYPRYKKSHSFGSSQSRIGLIMDEAEPEIEAKRHGETGANDPEIKEFPVVVDSGKGSSPEDKAVESSFDIGGTPKENADSLEPSLMDRRMGWDAKDQIENREANHFEALERFLAAMNSTLRSDCSALFRAGSAANDTPTREAMGTSANSTPDTRNAVQNPTNESPNPALSPTPAPPCLDQLSRLPFGMTAASTANPAAWRIPQSDAYLPPKLNLPMLRPPHLFMDTTRPNPPTAGNPALMVIERELRALMASLERDADELQRRRTLLDDHTEATKQQLCAEWQNIEREKERLKTQRLKIEMDKNDLLTHRTKLEEEMHGKLEKCNKAQEELKMLQTECQLLKKKLVEQKKQSSDEISAVQQQVIDLQRQAVESDSRASSFRTQISKLKEECRQHKEESESAKARNKLLESANDRLRAENSQLRIQLVEQRDKTTINAPTSAAKCLKTPAANGDQGKPMPSQTSKCVRFADEPTSFRRTKDFCVQAAGPSDMATQTSFLEMAPAFEDWSAENNPILERTISDGKKEIIYPNDTVQIQDKDGAETFNYASGDILRCLPDGTKGHFRHDLSLPDHGHQKKTFLICWLRIYHSASDGRTEIRNPDGTLVVKNADGSSENYKFMQDGTEIVTYSNGTIVEKRPYGIEIAHLYDKSKETRCSHYTLREFPGGDIKKLYADGSTETRLACGRVRVKDPQGNVVKDVDEYPARPPA